LSATFVRDSQKADNLQARNMLSQSTSKLSFLALFNTAALAFSLTSQAQIRPLNDTGQPLCYDAANAAVPCSAAVSGDAGVNPRQDGRYGRDAAAAAGQLTKIGAGDAGFDFTKISNNGSVLPASAVLGSGPTDWACTRDNVTGLMWEVKTTSGLRSSFHAYTWYSADGTNNGGDAGGLGSNTCAGTLSATPYNNQCNTQNFASAVNAISLCGHSDWRLPRHKELRSIVHLGRTNPSLDEHYFPDFPEPDLVRQWTATTSSQFASYALIVAPRLGQSSALRKEFGNGSIRLVRGDL
jgi:hypothetical protein